MFTKADAEVVCSLVQGQWFPELACKQQKEIIFSVIEKKKKVLTLHQGPLETGRASKISAPSFSSMSALLKNFGFQRKTLNYPPSKIKPNYLGSSIPVCQIPAVNHTEALRSLV